MHHELFMQQIKIFERCYYACDSSQNILFVAFLHQRDHGHWSGILRNTHTRTEILLVVNHIARLDEQLQDIVFSKKPCTLHGSAQYVHEVVWTMVGHLPPIPRLAYCETWNAQ